MTLRDWHTVTKGSARWEETLSIFCGWTHTYTYFPQYTWDWQVLSFSVLPFPEVCHTAMPTKCAESIAWQCFHSKLSWLGATQTSLAPHTRWIITAVSLSAEVHDLDSLMPSASLSATISHLPAWHLHPITQADRKNPNHRITDWRTKSCIT